MVQMNKTVSSQLTFHILLTGDTHMNLVGHNYEADQEIALGSFAHLATAVSATREKLSNVLLLDVGDTFEGNLCGSLFSPDLQAVHPSILAMNAIGYDAATVGNHDFDYGLGVIAAHTSRAQFPFVLSNIRGADAPLQGDLMIERDFVCHDGARTKLKFGIIGLCPNPISGSDSPLGQITYENMVTCARRKANLLRQDGADVVIALAHTGLGSAKMPYSDDHAGIHLCHIDGIDVVLLGHEHRLLPDDGIDLEYCDDVPMIMAGAKCATLGKLTVTLTRDTNAWSVASFHREFIHTNTFAPNPSIRKTLEPYHARAIEHANAPLSKGPSPLHSYFAMLGLDRAYHLVAKAWQQAVSPHISPNDPPILCAVPIHRAGGIAGPTSYVDAPNGDLARRHSAQLFPHADPLRLIEISGAQLRKWLETCAQIFRPLIPKQQHQPLLASNFRPYLFDYVYGVTYEIDPSAHSRIKNLALGGQLIQPLDQFLLLTSEHRLRQMHGVVGDAKIRPLPNISCAQSVETYLATSPALAVAPPATWRFTPLEDTSILFETVSAAKPYWSEIQQFAPTPLVETQSGLIILRLGLA